MTVQLLQTPVGVLAAHWNADDLLTSCQLVGDPCAAPASPWRGRQKLLAERLQSYFRSGQLDWDLTYLDWSGISDFHRSVLRCCFEIPSGQTLSYAALAQLAGSAKAARAVGGAMARNRWPILIPCHRVVGSTGRLVGYSGQGGVATKRRLLEWEAREAAVAL